MQIENSVFLFDEFYPETSQRVIEELMTISESFTEATIYINSAGGYIKDLYAILDTMDKLREEGMTINTVGLGLAASSGFFVLIYGDNPQAGENTEIFAHGVQSVAIGSEEEIKDHLKVVRKINDRFETYLSENSNMTKDEAREFLKSDTSMTAQEALEHGMIDSLWNGTKDLEEEISEYGFAASKNFTIDNKLMMANKFIKSLKPKKNDKNIKEDGMSELTDLQAKLNTSNETMIALQKENEAFKAQLTEKDTKYAELKAKLETFESNLKAESEARKQSVIDSTLKLVIENDRDTVKSILEAVKDSKTDNEFSVLADNLVKASKKKQPETEVKTDSKDATVLDSKGTELTAEAKAELDELSEKPNQFLESIENSRQ